MKMSVITPCDSAGKYIEETIRSVLGQREISVHFLSSFQADIKED
jgi:glycosyltransferase involved in cell wall biosynthesis